jgi:hypothetical protein
MPTKLIIQPLLRAILFRYRQCGHTAARPRLVLGITWIRRTCLRGVAIWTSAEAADSSSRSQAAERCMAGIRLSHRPPIGAVEGIAERSIGRCQRDAIIAEIPMSQWPGSARSRCWRRGELRCSRHQRKTALAAHQCERPCPGRRRRERSIAALALTASRH